MSGKTKSVDVKREKTDHDESFSLQDSRVAMPRLRFPEFRSSEAWTSLPMGNLYSFKGNNSLSRDKLNYASGSVRNIHYGDIHTKFSSHFDIAKERVPFVNDTETDLIREDHLCAEGDMIFADASEDLADIGKSIELVRLNGERVVSGLHTILARPISHRIALGFAGHLFKSRWVRTQIQKESQGAKVLGLSATRLRKVQLPMPQSNAEQRKIAECLSSLDELMAAQARKVDALKTHKKGLMQQLFPREGETQPRLRFPEFQNASAWSEAVLGDFIEEFRRKSNTQGEFEVLTSSRGGLIRQRDYYDNDRITERDNVGFNVIPPNYITYRSRSDDRQFYFNENELGITGIVSVYYPVFKMANGSNKFLIELLSAFSTRVGKHSVGTSQTVLSLNQLGRIRLPLPIEREQQRIASCLSTLDRQITAETQKLETLKTHKKGLMQQLFPTNEKVDS